MTGGLSIVLLTGKFPNPTFIALSSLGTHYLTSVLQTKKVFWKQEQSFT